MISTVLIWENCGNYAGIILGTMQGIINLTVMLASFVNTKQAKLIGTFQNSVGKDQDTHSIGLALKNRTCLDNPVILSVKSYEMAD